MSDWFEEILETVQRRASLPQQDLIGVMFLAFDALRRQGWREAHGAPKGQVLELIEPGSTGIHRGTRDEEGHFWIEDAGDIYPSRPILYRPLTN